MGFSRKQKREIIKALQTLRLQKKQCTFSDIEDVIWALPPTFMKKLLRVIIGKKHVNIV
jgi:hypothetical protein